LAVSALIVIAVVFCVPSSVIYLRTGEALKQDVQNSSGTNYALEIRIVLSDLDLPSAKYHIQILVNDNPSPGVGSTFFDSTGSFVSKSFYMRIGDMVQIFSAGNPALPIEIDTKFSSYTLDLYPFDTWQTSIKLDARLNNTHEQIPINTIVSPALLPYFFYNYITFDSGGVNITLTRDTTTKVLFFMSMIAMWVLTISTVMVIYTAIYEKKKPEVDMMVVTAALLFGLNVIRGMAPDVPAVGMLGDVYGYFWSITILIITTFVIMILWVLRPDDGNHHDLRDHVLRPDNGNIQQHSA